MKKVATIILNRNLPKITDKLYSHILTFDSDTTDVYIVEAGSDIDKLSKNKTWYANWPEAMDKGLRYSRGMNYGLSNLWKEGKFQNYDAFFLLTNDTELHEKPTIKILLSVLESHPKVGILSPCSQRWGEKLLLQGEIKTKYFWFIHNSSYLLRRSFLEEIIDKENPDYMNFLFDGANFRGYCSESELIAKAYSNYWAAAITSEAFSNENESYLLNHSDLIKTENYEKNIKLYVQEGKKWMIRKYGFRSKWSMNSYVKHFYDSFFDFYPEYNDYKI